MPGPDLNSILLPALVYWQLVCQDRSVDEDVLFWHRSPLWTDRCGSSVGQLFNCAPYSVDCLQYCRDAETPERTVGLRASLHFHRDVILPLKKRKKEKKKKTRRERKREKISGSGWSQDISVTTFDVLVIFEAFFESQRGGIELLAGQNKHCLDNWQQEESLGNG